MATPRVTFNRDYFVTRSTVDPVTGCWNWNRHLDRHGYGRAVSELAHRRAYESLVGPVPEGLQLDHLCRNRRCVNPDHLEPVTREENLRRGIQWPHVQRAATHCVNGHPFDEANTYWRPSGQRDCRACGVVRQRNCRLRKAAANGYRLLGCVETSGGSGDLLSPTDVSTEPQAGAASGASPALTLAGDAGSALPDGQLVLTGAAFRRDHEAAA